MSAGIVGCSHTAFARASEPILDAMTVAVTNAAIADAGMAPADIDAVSFGHLDGGSAAQALTASLVLEPATRIESACATGSAAIHAGLQRIAARQAFLVLCVGVEKMSESSAEAVRRILLRCAYRADEEGRDSSLAGIFGQIAEAYFRRHGDQSDVLAAIAAKNHANAPRRKSRGTVIPPLLRSAADRPWRFRGCRLSPKLTARVTGHLRNVDLVFALEKLAFRPTTLLDRFLGRIVENGELTIIDAEGSRRTYGRDDGSGRRVVLRLADAQVIPDVLRHPKVGVGEAYMDGRLILEEGDVLGLLDLITSNAPWEAGGRTRKVIGRGTGTLLRKLALFNWRARAARNVAHHYDLSDRLYDLFLDSDRQYSCAYFRDPDATIEQAQADKKAHIAAKLHLEPKQRVLDIGCGWGGMALYLHRIADVDVLGITLSREQLEVARERAEAAGVADRVRFELIDYRDVEGRFDRIVSVGMFEHVGPRHYLAFFEKTRALLAPDGVMLLHTIGRMGGPGVPNAWTNKYIFPGSYVPALSEIITASEQTRLIAADIEMLRLHYAYTLAAWYRRAHEQRAEIVALYDERFFRMWEFYLAYALVGFRHGSMVNYQIQYIRDRRALPITRDYLAERETALKNTQPRNAA